MEAVVALNWRRIGITVLEDVAETSISVHNLDTIPVRSKDGVVIIQEEEIVYHYGQRA